VIRDPEQNIAGSSAHAVDGYALHDPDALLATADEVIE
jgi:hypothetical protein